MPLIMVALTALVPTYREVPPAGSPAPAGLWVGHRPLRDLTVRLRPYPSGPPRPGSVALLGDHCWEAGAYVWKGRYTVLDYGPLERDWPGAGKPLAQILAERNAGLLYLNERMLGYLEQARPKEAWAFLNGPLPPDWLCVNGGNDPGDRWRLYVRTAP